MARQDESRLGTPGLPRPRESRICGEPLHAICKMLALCKADHSIERAAATGMQRARGHSGTGWVEVGSSFDSGRICFSFVCSRLVALQSAVAADRTQHEGDLAVLMREGEHHDAHPAGFRGPRNKMVSKYSRDFLAGSLRELRTVLGMVREGIFVTDATRSGRCVAPDAGSSSSQRGVRDQRGGQL